ncbi:MAG: cobalamin biosynthesis protein CobD [Chloroflexi bacterium]|nr:cobalamin biosynthesis protein CobD [Chloroflexota bacterium]
MARTDSIPALSFFVAVLVDLVAGEPPAPVHPVVWMGRVVDGLRRRAPKEGPVRQLLYGAGMAVAPPAVYAVGTWLVLRALGRVHPVVRLAAEVAILKSMFAIRELIRSVERVEAALAADRPDEAREALRSLVSRDTSGLGTDLLAAAAIESVAENASDSFVGPMLATLAFGVPGAVTYRAINTADSMIGYHGAYEYLGKAAARLDDLANLVPARATGWLVVAGSALAGGDWQRARAIMRRDHTRTESPNAGWPMSAMAGALGVRLEKVGHYRLGDPDQAIQPADVGRAVRIVRAALLVAVGASILVGGMRELSRASETARRNR